MIRTHFLHFILFLGLCGIYSGCSDSVKEETSDKQNQQTVTGLQTQVKYATRFKITSDNGLPVVQVANPFKNRADTLSYVMVSRGYTGPEENVDIIPIKTPVKSMVIFSTTHAAMLEVLNSHEVVAGIGEAEWIVSKRFRKRIEEGTIKKLPGAQNLALEQLIALQPEVVMVVGQFYTQYKKLQKLREMGIEVIVNSDWMENTPLGRAEWLKMVGLLTGKTEQATSYFNKIEQEYHAIDKLTYKEEDRPTVLMNLSFKDQWYVPGGKSYMAALLEHAGADYPWADNGERGGVPMDFESVYETGLKADIWLNPGEADSLNDILRTDNRLAHFKAFKTGNVYNITGRKNPNGGYDFWERGIVHPEEILADITKIMYPSKLPDHELIYYERIE